jgi:hypothetical protein
MYNNVPSITTPISNMRSWDGQQIDPLANLQNRQIYMEIGTADPTVGLNPMNQLRSQLANFGDPAKTSFVTTQGAGHTFPTDFDAPGNSPCNVGSRSPFISNCGYDGAGEVLKWMYGSLSPRNDGTLTGSVVEYDQSGSFGAGGMGSKGYVYVPAACQGGSTTCKLHVALHGCQQSNTNIGRTFVDNTGYNKWAGESAFCLRTGGSSVLTRVVLDTNNIIILYPQTIPDYIPKIVWGGTLLPNPNACWDWVGWYGLDADQKGGELSSWSMQMIMMRGVG